MKKLINVFFVGLLLTAPLKLYAKVNIFTCEPEWQSLAQEIGGNKVKAFSATNANQDPHHIRARPSLVSKIIRAELIICSGGGLEEGWLPILLQRASSKVQVGHVGSIMAIDYVNLIEIPQDIDRSMGHIHPNGNSHIHLNPYNILKIAEEITARLKSLDKKNSQFYQTNFDEFSLRWNASILKWENLAKNIDVKSVIVHHGSMNYLFDWLNIEIVASMEPKPGIPPTVTHLEKLLQVVKAKPVDLLVRTAYEPNDASDWLSDKIKVKAVQMPYTIGGDKQTNNLFELFDRSLALLEGSI